MARIAESNKTQLDRIKKNIRHSWEYSRKNYDRFHEFRKYLFDTAIDDNQKTILADQGKPIIEFNFLMAYVSRLLGEFAKHEPSIYVRPANGIPIDPLIVKIVEDHIRHINYEANKNSCDYEVMKDLLSGGFSVIKVFTEWESSMSFTQVIRKIRVFDPTLCGFDPMARHSHKGDGRYAFELYPKTEEDFKRQYPDVNIDKVRYLRSIEGFNWSYLNQENEPILLIGEYFEKKMKKARIVKLSNGRVMTSKNYDKFVEWWHQQEQLGEIIEQVPNVVGRSRITEIETICRYNVIESEVFNYEETDYCYLPYVYVCGNNVILQEGESNNTYEFTMPYIYHAKGIQDLKNFSGQCLGNYLDNMIQHKFIVKKEAIPQEEEYQEPIRDVQHARTVVVNAFVDNNPEQQIPEPIREVVNPGAPPEVMGAFTACDGMSQMILGTFDSALGVNDNQLSGVAVIESATQSNAAAFPYIKGYLQSETQCGNIIADLIPKYKREKEFLPVIDKEGKRDYVGINGKNDDGTNQPRMDYNEKSLQVEISAGVNYSIAKNKALTQIFAMMQASPTAAEFFATEGFPIILDNMEFHGSDIAKEKAEKWLENKSKQPPQPSPDMLKMQSEMAKIQSKNMELQQKSQMHQSQIQIDIMKLQQDQAKLMRDLKLSEDENYRENKRADVEHAVKMHELHLKERDLEHKQTIDHHNSIRESLKTHNELRNSSNESL